MKRIISALCVMALAFSLVAGIGGFGSASASEAGSSILVAYFSATGTTKAIADHAADILGADLYEIVPTVPYTSADLNYGSADSRTSKEQNDPNARPAISGRVADMAQYDTVLLGYPIWWGQAPRIISTFLESYDFSGKTILPFCTSGSSPIGTSDDNLHALAPSAHWLDGRRFAAGTTRATISSWLDANGITAAKPATTAKPTATPKPTATAKPAPTATPRPTATATPKPVVTATPKPIATATPKPIATATPRPAATATPKPEASATPTLAAPTVTIGVASNGIKVTWNAVDGAPRYMVYYRENGGKWTRIGTTTATSYTRKAAQLKNGVTYQFTVRCCTDDKATFLSKYEASNSLRYYAAPTVKISKVSTGIKVTWNAVEGSPRYMVYYKENGGKWTRIGTTTDTTYTRKAAQLKNGVTYQFTVRCCTSDKKTLLGPYKASNGLKYTK